ncbi:MAG TPA: SAM-dependent methyltransferase [Anaerolineales bacterium]|nr:SAM-dependent methyltransferase [Anaerolineales bacterium]
MDPDTRQLVRDRILARESLIRAMFSGEQKGASLPWVKVTVRPVELKGQVHLQVSYFDEKKDITKNYLEEAESKVDELLALPFRNIYVESRAGDLQVNISKKGKAIINEKKASPAITDLSHDRPKNKILTTENAAPFLKAVGMMTEDGRVKADMQRKFKQVNEFLRLVEETGSLPAPRGEAIHVVDFGCGSGHLTFAMYFYLREILHLDAHVTGVDIKRELMDQLQAKSEALGSSQLKFQTGYISDYESGVHPDVVLALHACDTATDDALAKGIEWGSKLIVCAPCCQHELQEQMARVEMPEPLAPIFQHGIFFERMGDILTDTFRASILRIMGYRTDVTEFVPIEHTGKNLMIRAVKTSQPGNPRRVEEYRDLKAFWKLTPYLEKLLGEPYVRYL